MYDERMNTSYNPSSFRDISYRFLNESLHNKKLFFMRGVYYKVIYLKMEPTISWR